MNILVLFHYLILLTYCYLPFMPMKVLRYLYFTPIILPTLWVITGDCPLSKAHRNKNDKNSFTKKIYMKFNKNITQQQSNHVNTFILVLIMLIIATRFRNKC